MQIYLHQNEQQVGPFTVEDIGKMLAAGAISPTDYGWYEGLTEWQPLNAFIEVETAPQQPAPVAPRAKLPAGPVQTNLPTGPIQTNVKQGAVIGGWVCFALGVALMFLSMWSFFIYGPLFLVAFILSIIAMSQRRIVGGIVLLLATLVAPTILGLVLFSTRTAKLAKGMSEQIEREKVVAVSTEPASEPVASQPDAPPQATPAPQIKPATAKHPALDAKMGFRTYKLGTPLSQFNLADLNEGWAFVKSDLKAYFVRDFDKKLGAAEIDDIQLNFYQDLLQSVMVKVKGEQSATALKEVLTTAFGQPERKTSVFNNVLEWKGEDCTLTLTSEMMGGSTAEFSSKSVDAKIKSVTAQKAKAGAAEGAKDL